MEVDGDGLVVSGTHGSAKHGHGQVQPRGGGVKGRGRGKGQQPQPQTRAPLPRQPAVPPPVTNVNGRKPNGRQPHLQPQHHPPLPNKDFTFEDDPDGDVDELEGEEDGDDYDAEEYDDEDDDAEDDADGDGSQLDEDDAEDLDDEDEEDELEPQQQQQQQRRPAHHPRRVPNGRGVKDTAIPPPVRRGTAPVPPAMPGRRVPSGRGGARDGGLFNVGSSLTVTGAYTPASFSLLSSFTRLVHSKCPFLDTSFGFPPLYPSYIYRSSDLNRTISIITRRHPIFFHPYFRSIHIDYACH